MENPEKIKEEEKMTEEKFFKLLTELPGKGWKARILYGGEALLLAAPGSEKYIYDPLSAVAIEQGFQLTQGFQCFNSNEVSNLLGIDGEITGAIDGVARDVFPERPHLYGSERLKRHSELRKRILEIFGLPDSE